jgi:very-short-patch-repair endonuclease
MLLRYWARLYNKPTEAEKAIEPAIASLGERYRSQHPFFALRHIADFVLLDRKLIIEVDGKSHSAPKQIKKDLEHTIALKALGYEVIRVTNEQAMAAPWETVLAALSQKPETLDALQVKLARLKKECPELWVKKPRKKRKKGSAKKRASGRRKRPASRK